MLKTRRRLEPPPTDWHSPLEVFLGLLTKKIQNRDTDFMWQQSNVSQTLP